MIDINLWPIFSLCTFIFGVWVGHTQGHHAGWMTGWADCKSAWDRWENLRAIHERKQVGMDHETH